MIQVDGFYLYSSGYSIHPLEEMKAGDAFASWLFRLYIAQNALEILLQRSVYQNQIRSSRAAGQKLFDAINELVADPGRTKPITTYEAYQITNALSEFEHVLAAELGMMNLWLVLKKRGYDTTDLIQQGWVLFPPELVSKVQEAAPDISAATKCVAFNLPTAAAFHLLRAVELVLHRYYDVVTEGAPRPANRSVGGYLAELRESNKGEEKALSALKDLKDLHRNPVIHPEDNLDSIDEAIALLGTAQAAIIQMLRAIPEPQKALAAEAGTGQP